MFEPENIYLEGVEPDLIWAGTAFDEARESGFKDGSEEFFELYIANFVKQDFPSFTDPLGLNTDYFVSYGLWQAIKVNAQGVYYPYEDGSFLIPKEDVEKYARYSFNYAGSIENHSVEVCGDFNYEKLSGCYRVSNASLEGVYLVPDVIDVKRDKDTDVYNLLVDCYYREGLSEEDVTKDPTKFAKRISITLQRTEEVLEQDGVENVVTNYLYTSCSLVDETISENTAGEAK